MVNREGRTPRNLTSERVHVEEAVLDESGYVMCSSLISVNRKSLYCCLHIQFKNKWDLIDSEMHEKMANGTK